MERDLWSFKLPCLQIAVPPDYRASAECSQQKLSGLPDCSVRSPARKSGRTTRRQGAKLGGHPFVCLEDPD